VPARQDRQNLRKAHKNSSNRKIKPQFQRGFPESPSHPRDDEGKPGFLQSDSEMQIMLIVRWQLIESGIGKLKFALSETLELS
jgi:hypothetical protein